MSRRRREHGHNQGGNGSHRPQRRRPFALRAVLFLGKLALLIFLLPVLLLLMFFFAFALPSHASGQVVGKFFDRVLDWLVGPESQEIIVTGKRRKGFLKF